MELKVGDKLWLRYKIIDHRVKHKNFDIEILEIKPGNGNGFGRIFEYRNLKTNKKYLGYEKRIIQDHERYNEWTSKEELDVFTEGEWENA